MRIGQLCESSNEHVQPLKMSRDVYFRLKHPLVPCRVSTDIEGSG